jgi:hypothetical protein
MYAPHDPADAGVTTALERARSLHDKVRAAANRTKAQMGTTRRAADELQLSALCLVRSVAGLIWTHARMAGRDQPPARVDRRTGLPHRPGLPRRSRTPGTARRRRDKLAILEDRLREYRLLGAYDSQSKVRRAPSSRGPCGRQRVATASVQTANLQTPPAPPAACRRRCSASWMPPGGSSSWSAGRPRRCTPANTWVAQPLAGSPQPGGGPACSSWGETARRAPRARPECLRTPPLPPPPLQAPLVQEVLAFCEMAHSEDSATASFADVVHRRPRRAPPRTPPMRAADARCRGSRCRRSARPDARLRLAPSSAAGRTTCTARRCPSHPRWAGRSRRCSVHAGGRYEAGEGARLQRPPPERGARAAADACAGRGAAGRARVGAAQGPGGELPRRDGPLGGRQHQARRRCAAPGPPPGACPGHGGGRRSHARSLLRRRQADIAGGCRAAMPQPRAAACRCRRDEPSAGAAFSEASQSCGQYGGKLSLRPFTAAGGEPRRASTPPSLGAALGAVPARCPRPAARCRSRRPPPSPSGRPAPPPARAALQGAAPARAARTTARARWSCFATSTSPGAPGRGVTAAPTPPASAAPLPLPSGRVHRRSCAIAHRLRRWRRAQPRPTAAPRGRPAAG